MTERRHARIFYWGTTAERTAVGNSLDATSVGIRFWDTDTDLEYIWDGSGWSIVGVTDHGNLGGLDDDDHPQYLLLSSPLPLGAAWSPGQEVTLPNEGLHILDTNVSHDLIIKPGSDLTADRILTLTTGDAARAITLQGDPTLDDWFDQSVKSGDSPIFDGTNFTGIPDGALDETYINADGSVTLSAAWNVGAHQVTFGAGIAFDAASGANLITIPDSQAIAFSIIDNTSGFNYVHVQTSAQRQIVFNDDNEDIDFIWQSDTSDDGLSCRASDGHIGIGEAPDDTARLNVFGAISARSWYMLYNTTSAGKEIIIDESPNDELVFGDSAWAAVHIVNSTGAIMDADSSEIVFNDGGLDLNFRVEGSGEANALFVRGSDGHAGFGVAANNYARIYSQRDGAWTTNISEVGIYSYICNTPGAASQSDVVGFYAAVRNNDNNNCTGYQALYRGVSGWYGSGTLSAAYGFFPTVANQGTGQITIATGVRGRVSQVAAGGTIVTATGLQGEANLTAGTITTGRGLYIAEVEAVTAYGIYIGNLIDGSTAGWAIYSAATEDSYFAGDVGIGATPTAPLHAVNTGVRAVLVLDQQDVSEEFIEFLNGTIYTGKSGQDEYLKVVAGSNVRYLRLFA